MAEKPRVKAPVKRVPARGPDGPDRRRTVLIAAGGALVLVLLLGAFLALGVGGSGASPEDARKSLGAAGCSLQEIQAQPGQHTLGPDETAKWNTDPPTSGPHFGFNADGSVGTVIWGAYDEPVQLARVVHNLEHGGVYIFYGDDVSDDVVAQLRAFYDSHETGTILAPYPKLGDEIALGAWVAEEDGSAATGYLAKCDSFDEGAYGDFFSAFQFKGPERFPRDALLPGGP